MDGPALSGRERRILAELEQDLRVDRRLDHRLSTLRLGAVRRCWLTMLQVRATTVWLLVACSAGLAAAAGQMERPTAALVVFALVWVVTVLAVTALWVRRRERRRGRGTRGTG